MKCRLKSILKIRNTRISGLPLKKVFPVPFSLHKIFRDLEYVKETASPYHIRLKSVFTSFHYGNFCVDVQTKKPEISVYYVILIDTSKNNLPFWKITFEFFLTQDDIKFHSHFMFSLEIRLNSFIMEAVIIYHMVYI